MSPGREVKRTIENNPNMFYPNLGCYLVFTIYLKIKYFMYSMAKIVPNII